MNAALAAHARRPRPCVLAADPPGHLARHAHRCIECVGLARCRATASNPWANHAALLSSSSQAGDDVDDRVPHGNDVEARRFVGI